MFIIILCPYQMGWWTNHSAYVMLSIIIFDFFLKVGLEIWAQRYEWVIWVKDLNYSFFVCFTLFTLNLEDELILNFASAATNTLEHGNNI